MLESLGAFFNKLLINTAAYDVASIVKAWDENYFPSKQSSSQLFTSESLPLVWEQNFDNDENLSKLLMEGQKLIAEKTAKLALAKAQEEPDSLSELLMSKMTSEIAQSEAQLRLTESAYQRNLMRLSKIPEIDRTLSSIETKWERLESKWPSCVDRTDLKQILRNSKNQYQLLIILTPPLISPDCPTSFQNNLAQEIKNQLKRFIHFHHPEHSLYGVEFYGNYLNRDTFDTDKKYLKRIFASIPTAIIYCDILDRTIDFHIGVWGWQSPNFIEISSSFNWRSTLEKLQTKTDNEAENLYIVRQEIIKIYKFLATFLADWYYLNSDQNYEPKLFHLAPDLGLEAISIYDEVLKKVYCQNQATVHYKDGVRLLELGYYQQAVEKFDKFAKILDFNPDFKEAHPNFEDAKNQHDFATKYVYLEKLLVAGAWRDADIETVNVILKVIGKKDWWAVQVEDINKFPVADLIAIDRLWAKYSKGKFGLVQQAKIYHSLGGTKEYDREIRAKFCQAIGWRIGETWLKHDNLKFNPIEASPGHLPSIMGRLTPLGLWGGCLEWLSFLQAVS